MGASFSTSRKRKSCESDPPPTAQKKLKGVAKAAAVDDYQVFLSFRGPDTRNDFTDVLYEHMDRVGIRVFRDEDEIPVGQKIDIILQAIENSEICMPILSKNFASSAWCLREVEKMVELEKRVIPIFYKVSPYDVKLKTDLYKSAMAEHESKYGKDQVEKWKTALKKIAKIKGREVSANTSYTEFYKKFVNDVLGELLPRKRCDTDDLVGMHNQVESMMKLLDSGSDDRRYVVIHGMSGIGKTTLANVIFDKLSAKFDSACFLEDVRECFCRGNGFMDLQKHLLEHLDPKSVRRSNFPGDIRERFHKRNVLIVLDDVDKWEQIEKLAGKSNWFGAGSKIIITTRNRDVLNKGALDEDEVRAFEMKTLGYGEAHALFCWYAFRNYTPLAGFESFSREIIEGAGGLPLSLRVTGSLLYKKDEKVWTDVMLRLKKTPFEEVVKRLRISYDELADEQKEIFLDIACLSSIGWEKEKAIYMWEACELYPDYGLEVLSSMSLVKIHNSNSIWVHDQLRDLGKKIVREEGEESTKRSRLWEHKDALEVLMSKEGKEKVEVLSLDKPFEMSLTCKHFATFRVLRFLKLVGTIDVEGDFKNLLPKLAWFTWHLCPPILKATNLHMKNLVVLNLSYSFITERWGGWSLIHNLNNLKDLDFSHCQNLTRTPDFSETSRLERLELHHCSELREIHGSIGKLQRLKYLNLRNCYSLHGLPNEIGSLVDLEELQVGGSSRSWNFRGSLYSPSSVGHFKIVDIPDSIGGLAKLRRLAITECSWITALPESLGNLESLSDLNLSCNERIRELPSSFGGLVKLERLDLGGCRNLEVLPESFGCLESLTGLDLSWTKISELPNSLGGLVKLERLNLEGCHLRPTPTLHFSFHSFHRSNLEVLPDSLGSLRELKVLNLCGCKIRKLPASIGLMKKLEEIHISFGADAAVEEEVPTEIWSLSSLRKLTLRGSSISTLPSTISQLLLLEELSLYGNNKLQELPDLPLSLERLYVSSRSLQKTPDLSRLSNLMDLTVLNSDDYRWPQQHQLPKSKFEGIDKLTKLRYLELCVANASALLQFDLTGSLIQLESLRLEFWPDLSVYRGSVLPSASSFDLLRTSQARLGGLKLPDLSSLKNLSKLDIRNCMIEDGGLLEILGIQHLRNLTSVSLVNCGVELIELICLSKSLKSLTVINCGSLKTLPDLSELKTLHRLVIWIGKEVVEITGLGNVESLATLDIRFCDSLERLENLSKLEKLSQIYLWDCPKLRIVEGTERLTLSDLHIGNCRSLQNVDELKKRSKSGVINGLEFVTFG